MMTGDARRKSAAKIEGLKEHWYSASTWIAFGMCLVYGIVICFVPLIPRMLWEDCMQDCVIHYTPLIALAVFAIAMVVRVYVCKRRCLLLWTAFRYGVVSCGAVGLLVVIFASGSPMHVRQMEKFRTQMQESADIATIRAWAETYTPSPSCTAMGDSIIVPRADYPDCIKRLDPGTVIYDRKAETICIVFGSGFRHWGLTVARKGVRASEVDGLPLEDGAWVWMDRG